MSPIIVWPILIVLGLWVVAAVLALINLAIIGRHARKLAMPHLLLWVGFILQGMAWLIAPSSFWGKISAGWSVYLVIAYSLASPAFVMAHFIWLLRISRNIRASRKRTEAESVTQAGAVS